MQVEGEDWFYSEKVKEHFMKPKNILKNKKEIETFNGYGKVGNMKCGDIMEMWIKVIDEKIVDCKWRTFGSLHPEEKILMHDYTYKQAKYIKKGDIILDGEGKDNLIENIIIKKNKDKLLNFQLSTSKFYSIDVTNNHIIPAVKRNEISLINRKGKRWSEVSNNKALNIKSNLYSASKLKEGDFLLFHIPKKTKTNKEINQELATLLGYYVSDGGSPSKNRIIYYFGLEEKEYVSEIEKICKKNKWNYKIYKRNTENVLCLQINEPKIAKLLIKHGGKPGKKRFSKEILYLNPKKQMKIIDAYINGDGWVTQQNEKWKKQYFISTSNEIIANQLQIMLARNKIFAPLHYRPPRFFTIKGKQYRNTGEINLIFRKDTAYSRIKYSKKESAFLIPIQKIKSYSYTNKIIDLSLIQKPNTYRINGITLHNCASAIASTSMLSVMLTENGGMELKEALKITGKDITNRLGGLPAIKIHCSVLGDEALREAIKDYEKNKK
jgi:NifU-like protein involved in Fe-S cluster formation